MHVRIASPDDVDVIADLAMRLYAEGEHEASPASVAAVARSLAGVPHAYALLACDGEGDVAVPFALMTLVAESVAMYAHGRFGIIQELYVAQGRRGQGAGRALMDEAKRASRHGLAGRASKSPPLPSTSYRKARNSIAHSASRSPGRASSCRWRSVGIGALLRVAGRRSARHVAHVLRIPRREGRRAGDDRDDHRES